MGDDTELSPEREHLFKRAREFAYSARDEELRANMWRLSKVVADRDCPRDVADQCKPLYGLVGHALSKSLGELLPKLEAQVSRARQSRDRVNAIKISKSMLQQDALRDFYFAMPEVNLQTIWNNGENDLPSVEKQIVRVALRNKARIDSTVASPEICPTCFFTKSSCACERGWW